MSLTQKDFQTAAATLGVPVAAVKAVAEVEANGSGFLSDGRVKVQYEPHVMYQRLKANFGTERANRELAAHPKLIATKSGDYNSADTEDRQMDSAAKLIDRTSALESASWGAFQIMGYHWKALGYPSLQDFINDQYTDQGQLQTFVRFIKADPRLVRAMKAQDWKNFASIYNGPNFAKNKYDTKLAAAFKNAREA